MEDPLGVATPNVIDISSLISWQDDNSVPKLHLAITDAISKTPHFLYDRELNNKIAIWYVFFRFLFPDRQTVSLRPGGVLVS